MKILVTGSAGYIGSVLCKMAKELGHYVIAVDEQRHKHPYYDTAIQLKVGDSALIRVLESGNHISNLDAVFHLAASADVTDSTVWPLRYYENNVGQTALLFNNLIKAGWGGMTVFSSSAAVYGDPTYEGSLIENDTCSPTNPYGASKLVCEMLFDNAVKAHGLNVVSFRYFNVGGAYGDVGDHLSSPHILQRLCYAAKNDREFYIYGTDWPTHDGTCIRDYIHVKDVCEAHFDAVSLMRGADPDHRIYNLGTEEGTSVKEVISEFKKVTGSNIVSVPSKPRPGDPMILTANPLQFIKETGFEYRHSDLTTIIEDSWEHYNYV